LYWAKKIFLGKVKTRAHQYTALNDSLERQKVVLKAKKIEKSWESS